MNLLVPTNVAALALDLPEEQLERWAAAGVITAADTAPGPTPLWDIDQLREQLARHLAPEIADAPRHPEEPS